MQLSTTLLTPFAKFCRSSQEDHWERVRRGAFPCFSLKLLSSSCCPFISVHTYQLDFSILTFLDRSIFQAFLLVHSLYISVIIFAYFLVQFCLSIHCRHLGCEFGPANPPISSWLVHLFICNLINKPLFLFFDQYC
jgi:hypothetical protein